MEISSAEFVVGAVGLNDMPGDGLPEVAFAGRSNVGKSSLINRLAKRRNLARTSSTPGKTQQLNYYRINGCLYLVDLPGYGFVHGGTDLRARLGSLTERYLTGRDTLQAVIQLIDARRGPTELDHVMVDWLRQSQISFLLVFTKVDKLSRGKEKQMLSAVESTGELAGTEYVTFSAVSGRGRVDVLKWIQQAVQQAGGTGH